MSRFAVSYDIETGIDDSVVHSGTVELEAPDQREAGAAAVAWVHDNDPYADERIDPRVRLRRVVDLGDDLAERQGE